MTPLFCLNTTNLLNFLIRDLFKQHRVKLHIHFFCSLSLSCVASVLWYVLVHYEKVDVEFDSVLFEQIPNKKIV
jgi:hypothetical protein